MKKTNPLKTPLNALFGSEEVIGSNPIFSTKMASGNTGAFFIESVIEIRAIRRVKRSALRISNEVESPDSSITKKTVLSVVLCSALRIFKCTRVCRLVYQKPTANRTTISIHENSSRECGIYRIKPLNDFSSQHSFAIADH
ncbi:hypothetical protein SAMN05421813_12826 [Daejeonella rubra]|uniref:Uncharacterized protein n=1 Tax=Daejeonella rubra TaxID=990371 RepID=A0A1G9X2B1_9SPHI|nr:hypothetical protein [Daejeonella rubra]SDM90838.1 hypothetical protein SAMN05421813_12826 [Daejeonella rubra]